MKSWPALDILVQRAAPPDPDLAGFLGAFLDDFAPTAIVDLVVSPGGAAGWRVFFGSPEAREDAGDALAASPEWAARVRGTAIDVPDERWAERSQAGVTAVRVGRVIVTPPWDVERARTAVRKEEDARGRSGRRPGGDTVIVEIEPSMGFGTGHHESTRLCLRALQQIDLTGREVVDLGTGSGVLAIACVRLGCARVVAIDDDRDALAAAEGNVRRNGVSDRVALRLANLSSEAPGVAPAGVVVGNLTGALLRRHAREVMDRVAAGGCLVLGGFTLDERLAVVHAFAPFLVVREDSENGWAALTLRP